MRQGVSTKGSPPVEVLAGNTNGVWYQGWSKRCEMRLGVRGFSFILFVLVIFICITLATLANTGAYQIMWQCKQYSKGCLDLPLESHRQLLQSSKLYFLLKKKLKLEIKYLLIPQGMRPKAPQAPKMCDQRLPRCIVKAVPWVSDHSNCITKSRYEQWTRPKSHEKNEPGPSPMKKRYYVSQVWVMSFLNAFWMF